MIDDDPFAEPDDADRTVIKPNPGGRRRTPAAAPAAAPVTAPAAPPQADAPRADAAGDVAAAMTGPNPLNAAAATLFGLVSRIRNRAQHADPDALRRSVVDEIRAFESRAVGAGIDPKDVRVARYAICATLDDVVLNTPWGGRSAWAQQSMVGTFHRETVGGDRVYDLLARLEKDPGRNLMLLEFLHACLSLGFEGRLRVEPNGAERHLEIRAGLARIIRAQRGPVEHDLSPNWQGVEAPHRPLSAWKALWITGAVLVTCLALAFAALTWRLNGATERVVGQMSVLMPVSAPALMRRAPPPPPPVLTEAQVERVRGLLEAEVEEGLVEVFQDGQAITVRIVAEGMFGSASDRLEPAYEGTVARVARALADESGDVIVVGHSDNVPTRSGRWPSNMALSLARAEAVMRGMAGAFEDPARLRAEGRADKEPIAPNDTREGRAKNRRIEVLLIRDEAT